MLFFKETKEEISKDYVYLATRDEEGFIKDLKEDLETLKGESFQRHTPEYYDEYYYYNEFHRHIPNSLLLSSCYKVFIEGYRENNKSLYECVTAFIKEYESK